jgi:hypothetical protein
MRMETPLADFAAVVAISLCLTACATDMGGPGGRDGPPRGGRGGAESEAGWTGYDLNGDGKVTRAEFSAVRTLCFVRADANGDGLLTRVEIRRLREGRPGGPGGPAASRPDPDGERDISREEYDRAGDGLWRLLDTNADGVLAGMELSALSAAAQNDPCQSSGSSPAREGPGGAGPRGGPGPGGRR